jgi:hypothetical protein
MLKEALQYLFDQGKQLAQPIKLDILDARHFHFLNDGTPVAVPRPAPIRQTLIRSLEDFIRFAAESKSDDEAVQAVYFNEDRITLVNDEGAHRLERIYFVLEESDQWSTTEGLRDNAQWMQAKQFVRLLRVDLAGALPSNQLVDIVRSVKFENGTMMTVETKRQRESMGKEILAAVKTDQDIPEEVTLQIPVYKSHGENERYGLRCAVEVDPSTLAAFRLTPLPDEIERVQALAVQSIGDRLRAELPSSIPSYYGSP